MTLIIDGHNLIGTLPDIHLDEPDDEARLLARLRAYRSHSGQNLIVFFDSGGFPTAKSDLSSPGVAVRFAAPGQTADDAIVDFLLGRAQPGQYAVVTNDAGLTWRVKTAGASVMRAQAFAQKLGRPSHQGRGPATEPAPNPQDPAYADIYAEFLAAERVRKRLPRTSEEPAQIWIERLYGEDAELAQKAAQWLGQRGDKKALSPLRDALTHSDVRVRTAALLALADLGDRAAVCDLERHLLHDAGSMAREAAAQSLGRIGDRSAEPVLVQAAQTDTKSKVRKAALAALAQIRAKKR
jgi:hypothetical protein